MKEHHAKTIDNDLFEVGGKILTSRLFIGTGKYASDDIIPQVCKHSGACVITVALRRVDFHSKTDNVMQHIPEHMQLMPNTSGARNADEAVRIARLARAMGCGNWIKIEVITDNRYLLPDGYETVKATEILVRENFSVFPYINPDLYVARDLVNAGASAIMPLGAPIGTNRGIRTEEMIHILIEEIDIPVIVDAGIGKPSHACQAMESGADACLVNTAIATSDNPVLMGEAFADAVHSGRKAYLAGQAVTQQWASASSPLTGFLSSLEKNS
jgi:thiazole synthase